jgi:hypothetical protein
MTEERIALSVAGKIGKMDLRLFETHEEMRDLYFTVACVVVKHEGVYACGPCITCYADTQCPYKWIAKHMEEPAFDLKALTGVMAPQLKRRNKTLQRLEDDGLPPEDEDSNHGVQPLTLNP